MKIIRYSDLLEIPWKNGAGVRREVIAGEIPADSREALACQWSIGLADLNQDAPFSSYPLVSRWFLPLGAGRLTLMFKEGVQERPVFKEGAQERPVHLHGASGAHHFSGANEVRLLLHDGPMKALNVMTTGRVPTVSMERLHLTPHGRCDWAISADDISLLILLTGHCHITGGQAHELLKPLDSAVSDGDQSSFYELSADSPCEIVKVKILKKEA